MLTPMFNLSNDPPETLRGQIQMFLPHCPNPGPFSRSFQDAFLGLDFMATSQDSPPRAALGTESCQRGCASRMARGGER